MSTFSGKIQEIPYISVDRFDDYNLDSDVYFLSHCHSDHMVGLDSKEFQDILIQKKIFLYASPTSCKILSKMFPAIEHCLKELDMYSSTSIQVKNKFISVTPIPAGHCPGSIMFLFENDVCILYTGDYRINSRDIKKIKSFYNTLNTVKTIDTIYLDTTFFLQSYLRFPTREESLNELCDLIKNWISKSKKNVIKIETSAKYGYEYLFNEIYTKLKMPVHVNEEVFNLYKLFPEMDDSVTRDKFATQIHSACGNTYKFICRENDNLESNIKPIKISALRWKYENLNNGSHAVEFGVHYLCYSTHASYEEGVALIQFLKPQKIEPCVMQRNKKDNVLMYKLIDELLGNDKSDDSQEEPKLFRINSKERADENNVKYQNHDNISILDSPPRKRR